METSARQLFHFPSGGGIGKAGNGKSDGDYSDASQPGRPDGTLLALMTKHGLSWESISTEVRQAFEQGRIGEDVVRNYILARANPVSRLLMSLSQGLRNRFLADERFLLKILIEESLGLCGKLSAEWERRRDRFWKEIDFVFANVIMAFLADFALVYFPAPAISLSGSHISHSSWIANFAKDLPGSVFQVGHRYTLGQRMISYFYKVGQLSMTGFCCSFIGVALTNSIIMIRKALDPSFTPENQMSNVLTTSAAYGLFLGVSAGTRYQLVNGIEQHIFPRIFSSTPKAESIATFLLRWGNTFWGSQQWVMFAKFTGVQKSSNQVKQMIK
ncbi:protein reticulata-related 4, chloroplastic [Galdieria sulphuraria]|nr:protein reticulata-related 4, chloroplastic [Galdieria sulphuraria]